MVIIAPLPTPCLSTTLLEVFRVLKLHLSEHLLADLDAVAQDPDLTELWEAATSTMSPNLSAVGFRRFLLSQDHPVALTLSLPVLLAGPSHTITQCQQVARLLFSIATNFRTPSASLSQDHLGRKLDPEQQKYLLATSRVEKDSQDTYVHHADSRNVCIWKGGAAWTVDVIDSKGGVVPMESLLEVVHRIMSTTRTPTNAAHMSWVLKRSEWRKLKPSLGPAIARLEKVITTVAIEEYRVPSRHNDALEDLRSGSSSRNRYSDCVTNFVVWQDGESNTRLAAQSCVLLTIWSVSGALGMSVDHAAVDGSAVISLADAVLKTMPAIVEGDLTALQCDSDFAALEFDHFAAPAVPLPVGLSFHGRSTIEVAPSSTVPTHVIDTLASNNLLGFCLHLTFQHAISKLQAKNPDMKWPLFLQPVAMRHYTTGRSDPTFPETSESRRLLQRLNAALSGARHVKAEDAGLMLNLMDLFSSAHKVHRSLIRRAKLGEGVGPHISVLRNAVPKQEQYQPLLEALTRFSGAESPIVTLTGFENTNAKAALANV